MTAAAFFEIVMLVCFGISWPVHNLRTWRVKRTEGQSLGFMLLIFIGYGAGMLFNLLRADGPTGAFFLYLFNLLMVASAIALNRRYRDRAGGGERSAHPDSASGAGG